MKSKIQTYREEKIIIFIKIIIISIFMGLVISYIDYYFNLDAGAMFLIGGGLMSFLYGYYFLIEKVKIRKTRGKEQ